MTSTVHRRLVFALSAFGLLMTLALTSALAASNGTRQQGLNVDLGPLERFAPGSVTTFVLHDGQLREVTDLPRGRVTPWGMHVVRLESVDDSRSVRVFSWRSPDSGSAIWWMPDGTTQFDPGYFVDPASGSLWRYSGAFVIGGGNRNLDYFRARVNAAGRVIVDVSQVVEGGDPPDPPLRVRRLVPVLDGLTLAHRCCVMRITVRGAESASL